jgi:hypothetical protein
MLHRYTIARLVGSVLLWLMLGDFASAQIVDPCGYGCPKEECPQCPTGGPKGAKEEQDTMGSDRCSDHVQIKQSRDHALQEMPDTLIAAALVTCSACDANRSSCFANCNASGPAIPGGQVECIKQCHRNFPCVPNRDCQ